MVEKNRKKGLGRGLSALLAETNTGNDEGLSFTKIADYQLPIEKIIPNFNQPRKRFDKLKLEELSKSITNNGIIQPIIVRPKGSKYELIAGERRWRAAQLSKIHKIPALVRELTDKQAAEYAIAENIQREDLTPVEEAKSYKSLLEIYGYTQEDVAFSLGKSRSYIANMLRLLTLPQAIINFLEESKISIGHARALIGLENAEKIAKKIVKSQLSVRQTEAFVRRIRSDHNLSPFKAQLSQIKDIDTLNLEKSLSFHTKFKIKIDQNNNNNGGRLIFNFNNLEELDQICDFLQRV
tara:strand:- start:454 stop:1338 length:885 start_codon:yes stop_codon:yes gene_type:complete